MKLFSKLPIWKRKKGMLKMDKLNTQEITAQYAHKLASKMTNITDNVIKPFFVPEYDEDDPWYKLGLDLLIKAYNNSIDIEASMAMTVEQAEEDANNIELMVNNAQYMNHFYEMDYDAYLELVKQYTNTFGIRLDEMNQNLYIPFDVRYGLVDDSRHKCYVISNYALEDAQNDMDLISNMNRTLFLGFDQFDSIHQPEFNACAMYKFVELQESPEDLIK